MSQPASELEVHHALTLKTNRDVIKFLPWAYRAECCCDWSSGPIWISKKMAVRLYRIHRSDLT